MLLSAHPWLVSTVLEATKESTIVSIGKEVCRNWRHLNAPAVTTRKLNLLSVCVSTEEANTRSTKQAYNT